MTDSQALAEKIGQLLLFGWSDGERGDSVSFNAHAAALVDDLYVGGVVLMARNVAPLPALRALTDTLQARAKAQGMPPLFVATDQEGGRVQRLGPPHYPARLAARAIGQTGNPDAARHAYAHIGSELSAAGINWDFAPVLDVDNNPQNPVIGARAFSDSPDLAAQMGVAAIEGLQNNARVMACGKHFPGHGDTDTDSHFALPRIVHPLSRLSAVELVPFHAAINAGIASLMTAHILFPALDTELPATLSPAILTGLLREQMGFDGLIVTDDLEMRGVAARWGAPEAAVLAFLAGADIVLCCHTRVTQYAIRDALMVAVQTGRLSEARLDTSLVRIARAKAQWLRGA